MGCNKKKIKSLLVVCLIIAILTTAVSPIVLGSHEDTINVTFDPQGDISLEVHPPTANFSTVTFSTSDNGPVEGAGDTAYTLYNNGTLAADIYIFSNTTTDGGEMTLDNGGSPSADEYSLDVTGSNAQQITNTNASWSSALAASGTITFGIDLDLGAGTQDWNWQKTTINVTGVINS